MLRLLLRTLARGVVYSLAYGGRRALKRMAVYTMANMAAHAVDEMVTRGYRARSRYGPPKWRPRK